MALLKFEVQADYEKVIRLREEIKQLKQEMLNTPAHTARFDQLNVQLGQATKEFRSLTDAALKAGLELETDFRKRIYSASQNVNDFTEKIIAQKAKVKDLQHEVKNLGETYREAAKNSNPLKAAYYKDEYSAAKKALEKERAALFELTQQQAEARLSAKRLRDEYVALKQDAGDGADAIWAMKEQLVGMGKDLLKNIGIGIGVKEFIGQMVQVRGEFQDIETSLEVLLGSEEKAVKLMGEVKEFAKVSPLVLKSTAAATQMMLGFNIEAEKVPRYLQAIGDISMGDAQRFNSLTLAFSQMSATGKLMGQDLNQMINAGFNPLQAIADKTGKSIATLKEEMSKGAISSQMVQQAFIDATEAGGKFYQMSEKASKTITGQISMMQDALDAMFNSLGEQSEDVIIGAISTTTSLIENYETVGKVLAGLIATYGTYKGVEIACLALEQARNKTLWANITATKAYTVAQAGWNKVMMANPYGLAAAALVALTVALWDASTKTNELEEAQKRLNNSFSIAQRDAIKEQSELARLKGQLSALEQGTAEYNSVRKQIIDGFGKYYDGLDQEIEKVGLTEAAYNKLTEAINKSMMARQYESFASEQQNLLGDTLSKSVEAIQKELYAYFGDEAGARLFTKIRAGLMDGTISKFGKGSTIQDTYGDEVGSALYKEASSRSGRKLIQNINKAAADYLREKRAYEKADKLARERFGITDQSLPTNEPSGEDIQLTKDRTYWEAELNKRKKAYEETLKGTKEASEALKKLQEAEKELAKYSSYRSTHSERGDDRLKIEQKAADDLVALKRQTEQSIINTLAEGTEKKTRQIELDYQKQKDAIDKQERTLRDQNKALKIDGLTDEQSNALEAQRKAAEKSRDKQMADTYKADMAYMRDYLKEYGTFQQQKLAIAEEYNQKINQSSNDWEKKSLAMQRDAALRQVDINAIKAEIDWNGLFSGVGTLVQSQIKPTLDRLNTLTESDAFKNYSLEEQQQIFDWIDQLKKQLGNDGLTATFKALGVATEEYNAAKRQQIETEEAVRKATEEYERVKKSLATMGPDGSTVWDVNNPELKAAFEAMINASDEHKKAANNAATSLNRVQEASEDVADNLSSLISGLHGLGSGSMTGILSGAKDIAGVFNRSNPDQNLTQKMATELSKKVGGAVGDVLAGPAGGQIVEGVFSLLDLFKDGIENLFSSLIDTTLGVIDGLLGSVLSTDIPVTIGRSIRDGVGNILDTVVDGFTLGHISSINWSGSNGKEVAETTERLTRRNEILTDSIDALKDAMNDVSGMKAIKAAEQAEKAQKEYNSNLSEILAAQMGYHGAHHSNSYYIEKALTSADWAAISKQTEAKVTNTTDLWRLTPEQLKQVSELTNIWEKIVTSGSYDKRDYLEAYLSQAGKIEEITESLKETMTSTSFDSMRSSFISSLLDMKKDAKDFTDDFSEYLMKAMLNSRIDDVLNDEMRSFYDDWAKYAKSDNALTSAEMDELKSRWQELAQQGIEIRDQIAAITGFDKSQYEQQSSVGYTAQLSEDTGTEIVGRMTALQDACEIIKTDGTQRTKSLEKINDTATEIYSVNTEIRDIADEARTIIVNSYLELQQINENTGVAAKHLKEIRSGIDEIKRNTANLN